MNPIERASHPSRAQISTLLDFFQKHPSLSKGFSRVPSARDAARKMWEKITQQLNSLEGCFKTTKQWIKYWADKKSAVKKKAALRFRAKNKTGGRAEVVELTDLEERILTLMGGESFAIGNRLIESNPSEDTNHDRLDSHTDSSPSLLGNQLSIGLDAATPNTTKIDSSTKVLLAEADVINIPSIESPQQTRLECVPGTSHLSSSSEVRIVYVQEQDSSTNFLLTEGDIINIPTIETPQQSRLECVPGTSHLSSSSSEVHIVSQCPMPREQAVPTTPPRVGSPVSSMPIKPSGSGRHPQRGILNVCQQAAGLARSSHNATSSSRRRRHHRPLSPPSQRQSHLTSLAERFLRVKEQQTEIQQQNLAILQSYLDNQTERDRSTAQAMQVIGDGLKLLAEVLQK